MPSTTSFVPRWATKSAARYDELGEMPNIGIQPELIPRLPMRLLPFTNGHSVSSSTVRDSIDVTQRIFSYVGHDLVLGPQAEFDDLRRTDERGRQIKELARMQIEPFDEGSFVIPFVLSEQLVNFDGRELSGHDVLARFVDVMESLGTERANEQPISIGLLQTIEDLGRITRREANIEYSATVKNRRQKLVVDGRFLETVATARKRRLCPTSRPDSVEGYLIAIDLEKGHLRLKLKDGHKSVVKGTFERLAEPKLIECVNRLVRLSGVIEYVNNRPSHIRTFFAELLE
jgi:hypothetical protein